MSIREMVTAQWNMAISFAWFILHKWNIEAERKTLPWSYLVSIKCGCSAIVFFLNSHVWSEVWLRFKEGFGLAISTNLVPKKYWKATYEHNKLHRTKQSTFSCYNKPPTAQIIDYFDHFTSVMFSMAASSNIYCTSLKPSSQGLYTLMTLFINRSYLKSLQCLLFCLNQQDCSLYLWKLPPSLFVKASWKSDSVDALWGYLLYSIQ